MKSQFQNYIFYSIPSYIFSILHINKSEEYNYYITTAKEYLDKIVLFLNLNHNLNSKIFTDLTSIDYLEKNYRFELVYNILSLSYHHRLFVRIWSDELSSVPSLVNIYPSINWFEREVWDLFGIHFSNNDDLRRILTDYGFHGHPMRKDFPLSGFTELYYSSSARLVCYRKISLIQGYRYFDTLSPWNYFSPFFES